jgi:hypothetical protein
VLTYTYVVQWQYQSSWCKKTKNANQKFLTSSLDWFFNVLELCAPSDRLERLPLLPSWQRLRNVTLRTCGLISWLINKRAIKFCYFFMNNIDGSVAKRFVFNFLFTHLTYHVVHLNEQQNFTNIICKLISFK